MRDFEIRADWLLGAGADLCHLAVIADNINLTAHKGKDPDTILVSARPFANWFLTSFWRLLYEPGPSSVEQLNHSWRMAHELQAAGGGFLWPNAVFFSCGENVEIRVSAALYGQEKIYSERYTKSGSVSVPAMLFREKIFSFLEDASERNDRLESFFNILKAEFDNEEIKRYRMLEAMLGYDPGCAPYELVNFLTSKFHSAGQETITELACALNWVNFDHPPEQLKLAQERLELSEKAPKGKIEVALDNLPDSDLPWLYGKECAHLLRGQCGISQEDSIPTKMLLDWTGLTAEQFAAIPQTGAIAACHREQKEVAFRFQTVFSPSARRFQLARALGGCLASSHCEKYLVISKASTWRQQMQRNFAAELLAPVNSVKDALDENGWTADTFMALAKKYQASPWTIANNLINNRVASRANVERILAEI